MELPLLSDKPVRHPKCCLSLSQPLLDTLGRVLQENLDPPGLVLSVGCGTGLLEELLHRHVAAGGLRVEGVEVAGEDAHGVFLAYLPEDRAHTVPGTWALSRRAADAAALLFVYPRSEGLVRRYVQQARETAPGGGGRLVLWLGPAADWDVFRGALEDGGRLRTVRTAAGPECGANEYEMMAVLKAT